MVERSLLPMEEVKKKILEKDPDEKTTEEELILKYYEEIRQKQEQKFCDYVEKSKN